MHPIYFYDNSTNTKQIRYNDDNCDTGKISYQKCFNRNTKISNQLLHDLIYELIFTYHL